MATFYETITAAVRDIAEHGYDSQARLVRWADEIRAAAARDLTPAHVLADELRRVFGSTYAQLVDRGGLLKNHKGAERFTIERVRPQLRAELDRRIMANASLIKLNRDAAIEKTIQRFVGWASSVPAGGSDIVRRSAVKSDVRKAMASLPFEERRVIVDQGHKFAADLSLILARDGGAIAGIWRHHHVRYPRAEHVARDGSVWLLRDSWAHKQGLVRPAAGFTDQIERPGELILCRCSYQWLHNLRDLPAAMLTTKGRAALLQLRAA